MYYVLASGKKKSKVGQGVLEQVIASLDRRKVEYTLLKSEYAGHMIELARDASNKEDCKALIAVGGDGTFYEVLNGMDTKVPVGFIVAGTGNDLARTLNIRTDVEESLDNILNYEPVYIDYLKIDKYRAFNVIGTGFDIQLLKKEQEIRKKTNSRFSYHKALIKTLLHFKFHHMRYRLDDGEWKEDDFFMLDCCNGIWGAGMMPLCFEADPHDGKINFVYIKKFPKLAVLMLLLKFQKGKHFDTKYVSQTICKKVELEITPNLEANLDGEILDLLPNTVEVVHNELKYFASHREPVDPRSYLATSKSRKESV